MKTIKLLCILLFGMVITAPLMATEKLKIVTATADLADLVRNIGGDRVKVISLSKGTQDPHSVEPRPSTVMNMKNADMVVRIGMDLDLWMQSLTDASKNSDVMYGARGYLDASDDIMKLEIPERKIDASMGDIHIYGNPHYWLDPENAIPILENIDRKLTELCPESKDYFDNNRRGYTDKLQKKIKEWQNRLEPFKGTRIVTYHNSWPYFAKRFNLVISGFIEPKPGIPPSPSHVISLTQKIKSEGIRVIIVEPYFNVKVAESIAKNTGIKVVVLPPSVGGIKGTDTFIGLFDYNINALVEALR